MLPRFGSVGTMDNNRNERIEYPSWVCCIRDQLADHAALCGRPTHSTDWCFQSVDHAINSLRHGDRLTPCPECCAVAITKLQEAITTVGEAMSTERRES